MGTSGKLEVTAGQKAHANLAFYRGSISCEPVSSAVESNSKPGHTDCRRHQKNIFPFQLLFNSHIAKHSQYVSFSPFLTGHSSRQKWPEPPGNG